MDTNHQRIAIFDADTAVAATLAVQLQDEGYEVRTTADSEVLIHWVVTWKPALVFVDMVGSADNAIAVMALLADAHSRAGVVLMGGMDRGGIRMAREFGAAKGLVHAGLLRKPFTRGHVLMALARSPHALEAVERVADPLEDLSEGEFAQALGEAVSQSQLRTVYQPKISCATGAVVGFEALARWDHPTLGQIPPGTFIPHAADQGLMRPITQAVTANALAWLGRARPSTTERMSINFTAAELKDRDQLRLLREDCERFQVAPSRVSLEVTHTAALADGIDAPLPWQFAFPRP